MYTSLLTIAAKGMSKFDLSLECLWEDLRKRICGILLFHKLWNNLVLGFQSLGKSFSWPEKDIIDNLKWCHPHNVTTNC